METVRKLTELDPRDLTETDPLPPWCNVLEGMSEQDRDEFRALLDAPVHLARSLPAAKPQATSFPSP